MHTISFGISCSVQIICSINIQYPANVLWYLQLLHLVQHSAWKMLATRLNMDDIFMLYICNFNCPHRLSLSWDPLWSTEIYIVCVKSIINHHWKDKNIFNLWIFITMILHRNIIWYIYCNINITTYCTITDILLLTEDNIFPAWLMADSRSWQSVVGAETEI